MTLYYHKFPISEPDRPIDTRIYVCEMWRFICYW